MILLSEGLLILLWVGMAYWHSRLIKKERPVKHGWWGLLSVLLIAAASMVLFLCHEIKLSQILPYQIAQACARPVVFNVCLNRFRRLSWNHTSTTTTSIIDQVEYRLFGPRAWIVEIALAVIFLFINFLVL